MSRRIVLWAVTLPLLGILAFVASSYLGRSSPFSFGNNGPPTLECPETIDFGEQDQGEIVLKRFTIANRGGDTLQVDQIRTSCACSGLEFEEGDRLVRISEFRLAPGREAHLAIRVSVRGEPGEAARILVRFHTNDPARPNPEIEALIPLITGVSTVPRSLAFGTVSVGSDVYKTFAIYDLSRRGRVVQRVFSDNPKSFSARFLPPGTGHHEEPLGTAPCIGRVEVRLESGRVGPVNGAVEIQFAGEAEKLVSIPVVGLVAGEVEVSPPALVLPRKSSGGDLYYGDCLCRNTKGHPVQVTVDSAPEGITAQVSAVEGDPAAQSVRITWDRNSARMAHAAPRAVRLKARWGNQETFLEVRVQCRSQE